MGRFDRVAAEIKTLKLRILAGHFTLSITSQTVIAQIYQPNNSTQMVKAAQTIYFSSNLVFFHLFLIVFWFF